ncbi:MAG TPA: biotin/lipoyl-binding protein, partial [Rectinemataceae bacterium]|nr:biotin/lipoyl-binding protein [Rectinemataceae bacterium]
MMHNSSFFGRFPLSLSLPLVVGSALLLASCARGPQVFEASGTIEATEVRVSSQVAGTILSVDAVEGSQVNKGDQLARIDPDAYRFQAGEAHAAADAAR